MEALRAELVDDGAKHDRTGRKITPAERIDALVREYQASGMTQAAFARRAGVKYPTFAGWVNGRRRRANVNAGNASVVRFAEVQVPTRAAVPAELSVTLPDGSVSRGTDATSLAALVRALRR
jgi:transposase-like protein